MYPLESINISGFKSIRSAKLDLRSLNVLIGGNGAGKTNFLSIFKLLSAIEKGKLQEYVARSGGASSLLHHGAKTTNSIEIYLEFGENQYRITLGTDQNDEMFFSDEIVYVWDRKKYSKPYDKSLGVGHRESKLRRSNEKIASYVSRAVSSWQLYHFHDTSETARVKATSNINDNATLASDASNLGAYLLLLREKHFSHYNQIVDAVRLAAPFFDDFYLRPNPRNPDTIRLEWRQRGTDSLFGPNDFSDGTLRFVCLATCLLQPSPPATILIDEPELGLHPYAITLLAGLFEVASRRMQVIASTQSVPLVNQFSPADLIVVERENDSTVFKRQDEAELSLWLDDYGLGDLWEKNVLGGRPTHA